MIRITRVTIWVIGVINLLDPVPLSLQVGLCRDYMKFRIVETQMEKEKETHFF